MSYGAIIIENRFDVIEIIKEHKKFLPKKMEVIHIDTTIKSYDEYNKLLTSKKFWEELPFSKVLIFQSDSKILRKGIQEFYKYDYIGAPWKFQEHGGNGGLSWRSKDAMLWAINHKTWTREQGNEDVYFSNVLKDSPYNLAPREVCSKFSCETIYKLGTFGCHAIEKYMTPKEVETILNQYKK